MAQIYLANTDFEFELERTQELPLAQAIESTPITAQLQFLPLLFASSSSSVLVSALPPKEYREQLLNTDWFDSPTKLPGLIPLDSQEFPKGKIAIWGASEGVARWANERKLTYEHPSLDSVRKVHTKAYTFEHCPQLPNSALLASHEELVFWFESLETTGVLKTCFGVAGRGHFLISDSKLTEEALDFCEREWQKGLSVLAEPWVDRVLDFSTQWQIDGKGNSEYLGATTLLNDENGQYLGTECGPGSALEKEFPQFLEEHLPIAEQLLQRVADDGYFGPVGVDAMIYLKDGVATLHPVVELNARVTMSSVALLARKKHCPDTSIRMTYSTAKSKGPPLLPTELVLSNGKRQRFRRQLTLQKID